MVKARSLQDLGAIKADLAARAAAEAADKNKPRPSVICSSAPWAQSNP